MLERKRQRKRAEPSAEAPTKSWCGQLVRARSLRALRRAQEASAQAAPAGAKQERERQEAAKVAEAQREAAAVRGAVR